LKYGNLDMASFLVASAELKLDGKPGEGGDGVEWTPRWQVGREISGRR